MSAVVPPGRHRPASSPPPQRVGLRLAALFGFVLLAAIAAPACIALDADALLVGRACAPETNACAPGFVCDLSSRTCVRPGDLAGGGGGGEGGGSDGTCVSPSDCPAPDSPCERVVCVDNRCGISAEPVGAVPDAQTPGDCQRLVCDGQGGVTTRNDDTDTPSDGNDCTDDSCIEGAITHEPRPPGAPCGDAGVCSDDTTCVACRNAGDCTTLPPDDECQTRACVGGTCVMNFTASGTPVAAQSVGDCVQRECDGAGAIVAVNLDTDVPDDNNPCTDDSCSAGVPQFDPAASGTACGASGLCDGAGQCQGCLSAADCGTDTVCTSFACNGGTCDVIQTSAGTPLPSGQQASGDCQQLVCNGNGGTTSVVDAVDIPPSDGNPCTSEACSMGSPQFPPVPVNSPCPAGFCDSGGSCGECNEPSQCANQGAICEQATCTGQMCGLEPKPGGSLAPGPSQMPGDCSVLECDGNGSDVSVPDPADTPDDNNDCTQNLCQGGMPVHPPAMAGTTCGTAGQCDGSGACVNATKSDGDPCASPFECVSGNCVDGVCCASACDGTCASCDGAVTGAMSGTCTLLSSETDPDDECGPDQTCDGGGACAFACGQDPDPPAGACPAACTGGCIGGTCRIDCNGAGACQGAMVNCPPGWRCEVQCGGPTSCMGATVTCPEKYACDLVCTGDCTATTLVCDSGPCAIECGVAGSCLNTVVQCDINTCNATCLGATTQPSLQCGGACGCSPC